MGAVEQAASPLAPVASVVMSAAQMVQAAFQRALTWATARNASLLEFESTLEGRSEEFCDQRELHLAGFILVIQQAGLPCFCSQDATCKSCSFTATIAGRRLSACCNAKVASDGLQSMYRLAACSRLHHQPPVIKAVATTNSLHSLSNCPALGFPTGSMTVQ